MRYKEWTRILGWPGYQVYQSEIDEERKTLKLWVRRKLGTKKLICSGCGRHCGEIHDVTEREVRDLPWSEYTATVVVELHRVRCPQCGPKIERVAQLPSKAPYSKRFEEAVGQACESAAARQVARRMGLAESTVRAIDLRCLERWEAKRRKPPLRQMGVDELYRGKADKFLTVVCNLETGEPLWFGKTRKKETLDEFFRSQLRPHQRKRIEAACVDMWAPFRQSIEQWAPQCKIVYDKFHILQHANDAIDEVRKAEFFRQGKQKRGLIKGKKWLLMSRWKNLTVPQRGELNRLFPLNRRVFKAYLLKESLEKLWNYRYEGAMFNYLEKWMDQLKWQRLTPFEQLADMLLKHLEGILNYCRTKVRFGVVEALNGNIRMLINRGRGYKNVRYLLLKAKRMAVTNLAYRHPAQRVAPGTAVDPKDMIPVTDLNVKSVIARPGEWAAPGVIAVQGVAWSNASPVAKVEISADAGKTWSPANFTGKPTKYGFRKFAYTWSAAEGQYTLMSRTTNQAGQSQPLEPEWNPNGYLYNAAQPRVVTISKLRPASIVPPEAETQPAPDGYQAACLVCHDEHMMRQQRLTRAQWDREVTKMTGWGAGVTPDQRNSLLEYLSASYKP